MKRNYRIAGPQQRYDSICQMDKIIVHYDGIIVYDFFYPFLNVVLVVIIEIFWIFVVCFAGYVYKARSL